MPEETRIGFYSRGTAHGFLSNFERASQVVDGVRYKSNEHYYQAQKALGTAEKGWITNAPSPWAAMRAGRALRPQEMRPDWEQVKLDIMLKGLRAKFGQNPDLAAKLLATGDAYLFEDSPTDSFWGAAKVTSDGPDGANHLGRLLMQVRTEIRK